MYRGSAPILPFEMPFDCSNLTKLHICFTQYFDEHNHCVAYSSLYKNKGKIIIEKIFNDVNISNNIITCQLLESDTLKFYEGNVYIQVRGELNNDPTTRFASDIITTTANRILKEGTLDEIIS